MGSESYSGNHIVMIPFMAHGHLIPFVGLANFIQQRTRITVTIANTPCNIQSLRSTISAAASASASDLRLAELQYSSSDHGLPPNTDNTENLSLDKMSTIFHSSTTLELPFRKLISDIIDKERRPPLCIISDVFLGWTVGVARSFDTPIYTFTTCGAYGTLAYVSLWLNLPHRSTTADEFPVPGFPEPCRFHRSQLHRFLRDADGTDSWSRYFQMQISLSLGSDGWLCNTVEEFESFALGLLRDYLKIPVWPIGPLLPPLALGNSDSSPGHEIIRPWGKDSGVALEKCTEWLNSHAADSVLYISFGSQNTISETQMLELAHGLEDSGKPFIWVVRPPLGHDIKGEFKAHQWLPSSFEERMEETKRGLLIRGWAPQLEILSHKSVGGFLSHCGWNSTVESLSQGVPIIGWPMAAEQAYNSKMLVEEMGVSVELARGLQMEIKREEVKKVIETVLGDQCKRGEEMKKKAAIIKEKIRAAVREDKGSSVRTVDKFLTLIQSKRQETVLPAVQIKYNFRQF